VLKGFRHYFKQPEVFNKVGKYISSPLSVHPSAQLHLSSHVQALIHLALPLHLLFRFFRFRWRHHFRMPNVQKGVLHHHLSVQHVRYADGISKVSGAALPSPRLISNLVFHGPEDGVTNNRDWSATTDAWGQYSDHDLMCIEASAPKDTITFDVPKGD
jgi:hypothetical protein